MAVPAEIPPLDCYTCNLSTRALRLVIRDGNSGRFHYDFRGRPLYIYTPFGHKTCILSDDLNPDELRSYYADMIQFMSDEGYGGYQIMMNFGNWITHKTGHLHFKISCDEPTLISKRTLHLRTR